MVGRGRGELSDHGTREGRGDGGSVEEGGTQGNTVGVRPLTQLHSTSPLLCRRRPRCAGEATWSIVGYPRHTSGRQLANLRPTPPERGCGVRQGLETLTGLGCHPGE